MLLFLPTASCLYFSSLPIYSKLLVKLTTFGSGKLDCGASLIMNTDAKHTQIRLGFHWFFLVLVPFLSIGNTRIERWLINFIQTLIFFWT